MKTKAFNLEMAKAGKKIQTKLGNPARIITILNNGLMVVAVKARHSLETPEKYNIDGTRLHCGSSLYDLEMETPYEA